MNNKHTHTLVVDNVSFHYKDTKKITQKWDNISFKINNGSVTSILGESGAGKTTLLKILSGIMQPGTGSVYINHPNNIVRQPNSPIFVVFQDYNLTLLPWLNIRDNILLGSYKTGNQVSEEELSEVVKSLFKEATYDYTTLMNKYPNNLSGGQRQRLQIARALVSNANFILFDEPDSAVDFAAKSNIRKLINFLSNDKGIGVVVITHDIDNAIAFSSDIYVLNKNNSNDNLTHFIVPKSLQRKKTLAEVVESEDYINLKYEIINQFYILNTE